MLYCTYQKELLFEISVTYVFLGSFVFIVEFTEGEERTFRVVLVVLTRPAPEILSAAFVGKIKILINKSNDRINVVFRFKINHLV